MSRKARYHAGYRGTLRRAIRLAGAMATSPERDDPWRPIKTACAVAALHQGVFP
jgi:hypothetical protein